MSNNDHQTDNIVHVKYPPESIPGTPESYHKISRDFEYASNALCSLGELMIGIRYDDLEEHTVEGLGYLLNILGNNLMMTSSKASELASKASEQKDAEQNNQASS